MEPYKASNLPIEYKIDKELLRLIAEANEKYGEYKSLLNTLEFDSSFFLDSVLLNESYKSTQIEGTQISQDESRRGNIAGFIRFRSMLPVMCEQ